MHAETSVEHLGPAGAKTRAKCPSMLHLLPPELLHGVMATLRAADMLAVARVDRACRAAATDDLWRALLARDLAPMLEAFFDGEVPAPCEGRSWRQQYFDVRFGWKRLAAERAGRLLVQIGAQRPSGRGPHEVPSLWCSTVRPATYGVYDVTAFSAEHPGIELREAAALADATEWFEMAAHSDAALRRLAALAVPGLEALPYDRELEALRTRRRSSCSSAPLNHLSSVTHPPASALGTVALGVAVVVFIVAGAAVSLLGLPAWWSDALSQALGALVAAAYASVQLWRFGRGLASLEKRSRADVARSTTFTG